MLPKSHRSLSEKEIQSLKSATTTHTSFFIAKHTQNQAGHLRVAILISKKTAKLATTRNRLKRQLLTAIHSSLLYNQPLNLLLIIKPNTITATFSQLTSSISELTHKLK